MAENSRTVFTKAEHIRNYLDIGDKVLNALIEMGMPVMVVGKRMFATKKGIDDWLYIATSSGVEVPMRDEG